MNKDQHYCILGLGLSGISCLEFLTKNNIKNITAVDIKKTVELLQVADRYPTVKFILGEFTIPDNVDVLVISPGIDQSLEVIQNAIKRGAKLTNDVNLFLAKINKLKKTKNIKIIAITGTNGKTTVVNILAAMAKQAGIKYALCGNVGDPVLNYLTQEFSLYILELSSFQLELIDQLYCDVACVLNITPDHLDRYLDFRAYCDAKLKIYQNAKNIVYCSEDPNTAELANKQMILDQVEVIGSFGKQVTKNPWHFGINLDNTWLMQGLQQLLPINKLALKGEHNVLNSLASLAIGSLVGFKREDMIEVLKTFTGLEHRCQVIGMFNSVVWINDSKGTNIGATIAAINAVGTHSYKKLIIILGGMNKNVDLSLLQPAVFTYCKAAILIGSCKEELFSILHKSLDCHKVSDLHKAVIIAKQIASSGDVVLFSPACASFDMFDDYKHRGEMFKKSVLELNHDQTTSKSNTF